MLNFNSNGHGVPEPSDNGEIWFFDESFTMYVPISIYSIHRIISYSPSIYIFDCANCSSLIKIFQKVILTERKKEIDDLIVLAPCSGVQIPQIPGFPLDFFTSALTSPLKIALKWWKLNNKLIGSSGKEFLADEFIKITPNCILIDKKKGIRSHWEKLNIILRCICDMIAWDRFNRQLFCKLFRKEDLVANLFLNFILAERILRCYGYRPKSIPFLPTTSKHQLWDVWDHTLDLFFDNYLQEDNKKIQKKFEDNLKDEYIAFGFGASEKKRKQSLFIYNSRRKPKVKKKNKKFNFFETQLKNFEISLNFGYNDATRYLPILYHVSINFVDLRLRALKLLSKYLNLGVGGFSYIKNVLYCGFLKHILKFSKVLLTQKNEKLETLVVRILLKIVLFDRSCVTELIEKKIYLLFINLLQRDDVKIDIKISICFLLSSMMYNNPKVKKIILRINELMGICIEQIRTKNEKFQMWLCVLLRESYQGVVSAQEMAIKLQVKDILLDLIVESDNPEVRAASLYAFTGLLGNHLSEISLLAISKTIFEFCFDGSKLVKNELIKLMASFIEILVQKRNEKKELNCGKFGHKEKIVIDLKDVNSKKILRKKAKKNSPAIKQYVNIVRSVGEGFMRESMRKLEIPKSNFEEKRPNEAKTPKTNFSFEKVKRKFYIKPRLKKTLSWNSKLSGKNTLVQRLSKKSFNGNQEKVSVMDPSDAPYITTVPLVGETNYIYKSIELLSRDILPQISEPAKKLLDIIHHHANAGQTEVIPSNSFYEWCCQKLKRDIVSPPKKCATPYDEIDSKRRGFSVGSISTLEKITSSKGMKRFKTLENKYRFVKVSFHPVNPLLFVLNRFWGISVFEYLKEKEYCQCLIKNTTDFSFINSGKLLCCVQSTGNVGIYKNFLADPKIIAGIRVFNNIEKANTQIFCNYQPYTTKLFCACNKLLKIWDLNNERELGLIETNRILSHETISCLSVNRTQKGNLNVFTCGYDKGSILMFDKRTIGSVASFKSTVKEKEHNYPIIQVCMPDFMQTSGGNQFISTDRNGVIKFWDNRKFSSLKTIITLEKNKLMGDCDVHNLFPIMIKSSGNTVFTTNISSNQKTGKNIVLKKVAKVNILKYHPTECLFAAADGFESKDIIIYN